VGGGLALPNQTPRVKALVLMYANRAEKDAAIATVMYAKGPDGTKLQTAYVEIISRYANGTLVQTNNSSQLGAFKAGRTSHDAVPHGTRRCSALRLHQALAERTGDRGRACASTKSSWRTRRLPGVGSGGRARRPDRHRPTCTSSPQERLYGRRGKGIPDDLGRCGRSRRSASSARRQEPAADDELEG